MRSGRQEVQPERPARRPSKGPSCFKESPVGNEKKLKKLREVLGKQVSRTEFSDMMGNFTEER